MMPTTAEYLNDLVNRKNELATALSENGVEVEEDETFSTLVPKAVEKIETGGNDELLNIVTNNGTRGDYLFYNCKINEIPQINFESVTSGTYMFCNCDSLEEVDITLLNCIDAGGMFRDCSKLKKAKINIPNATNASGILSLCGGLTEVSLNIPNVTNLNDAINPSGKIAELVIEAPKATTFIRFMENGGLGGSVNGRTIKINAPNATTYKNAFFNNKGSITNIHLTDTRKVTDWGSTFNICPVVSITGENLEFIKGLSNTFTKCDSLTDITPTRIATSFPISASPLTLESAIACINALDNNAGTENEYAYTITFSATTWGYLDAEGETASPNGNSWREYINDKGWNAS